MSKKLQIPLLVLVAYVGISFVHVWLNIGLDKLNFFSAGKENPTTFRVGFLPVT